MTYLKPSQLLLILSGILFAFLFWCIDFYLKKNYHSFFYYSVFLLPCCFPYLQILSRQILKKAKQHHISLNNFLTFEKLSQSPFLLFHQNGVLTCGRPQLTKTWWNLDRSCSKEFMDQVMTLLLQDSTYPPFKAIFSQVDKPEKIEITLIQKKEIGQVAVEALFKDSTHPEIQVTLGSHAWHHAQGHEMRNTAPNEENPIVLMLALNKKIVADFYLKDIERPSMEAVLDQLKRQMKIPLLITAYKKIVGVPLDSFFEKKLETLPIERELFLAKWEERASFPMIEIVAPWDKTTSEHSVCFSNKMNMRLSHGLVLHDEDAKPLLWCLKMSYFWVQTKKLFPPFALLTSLLLWLTPTDPLKIGTLLLFYFFNGYKLNKY